MNLQEYIDKLKPQSTQKTSQQIQLENILAQARRAGEEIRNKIGQPLSEGFGGFATNIAPKISNVLLNPGTAIVTPKLKGLGVSPLIAGGIGLGLDILAPGPGEFGKGKGLSKLGKKTITKESEELAEKGAVKLNKLTTTPKSVEPLIQEARKYKSAEEFVNAHTQSSLMDFSDPSRHRIGRIFTQVGDEVPIQDTIYINKEYGKAGGVLDSYPTANVPRTTNPEQMVKIHRAVNAKQKEILPGDYVSFSKDYAKSHLDEKIMERTGLLTKEVPAKDVIWQGNDMHEWIYSPESIRKQYPNGLTDIWNKANKK
jgi:hypothetical protein